MAQLLDNRLLVVPTVTLAALVALADAGKIAKIYCAVHTCWWTHDPTDLVTRVFSHLPVDPRGSVLLETDDPRKFLRGAESNPTHYGRHGVATFMASHAKNSRTYGPNGETQSWSESSWEAYAQALDRFLALPEHRLDHFLR